MIVRINNMNKKWEWAGHLFNKKPDKIDKKLSRNKSQSAEMKWTITQMEATSLQLIKTKKGWLLFVHRNQTKRRKEKEVLPTRQAPLSNQINSALLLRLSRKKSSKRKSPKINNSLRKHPRMWLLNRARPFMVA